MTIKKWALLILVPTLLLAARAYFGIRFISDLLWSAQMEPLPAITIEATYPGANASTVADLIAAPIENHVNGVEQMVSMRSRCGNDGSYTLTVNFKRGADLNIAKVLVQNRVQLATPILPDAVKRNEVAFKEKSPGFSLIVNLSSPDGRRDSVYLSNYAAINLKDELIRLPGISEVITNGQSVQGMRIEFDPNQLAARGLTLDDPIQAIRHHNFQVMARMGNIDPPPAKRLNVDQASGIILKMSPGGDRLHLMKDVARLEAAIIARNTARFNGKPVASLFVHPLPRADLKAVRSAVDECLARLRERLPEGLSLDVAFDFTTNRDRTPDADHLWLDVNLPVGASRERTLEVLNRSAKILRTMEQVSDVLELSGPPFAPLNEHGCILIRLAPANRGEADRTAIMQDIRIRLAKEIPEATIRLRDLSGTGRLPPGDYPINLAVHGPDPAKVRDFAAKLGARLRQTPEFTDVCVNAESELAPNLFVAIDNAKRRELGVLLEDVNTTLAICCGTGRIGGFENIDFRCSSGIAAGENIPQHVADIKRVKVRNSAGELVSLEGMVQVREEPSPRVIHRLDMLPMSEITANPAPGVPLSNARSHCKRLGEAVRLELGLPTEYRVTVLSGD